MFNTNYIHELISCQLSIDGYKHFINTTSFFISKYNWPKSIIVSNVSNKTNFWSNEEIKELTHQFFDWSLSKGKFDNLNKIPESYLSYYFTQILISFIANRIKEEQQKEGLSFEKCRELVKSISEDDYFVNTIESNQYVFKESFVQEDLIPFENMSDVFKHLSKIPIKISTKHYRPLVKIAIEDLLGLIETPILINSLTEAVYNLFDQKEFISWESNQEITNEFEFEISNAKLDEIIHNIVNGLTKEDAKMIFHFLFNNEKEQSISEIAGIYNIPKSTFHNKIDNFKKKISKNYHPVNESDGIYFLQKISNILDKLSK
jgi:predicted transcriptional regulator